MSNPIEEFLEFEQSSQNMEKTAQTGGGWKAHAARGLQWGVASTVPTIMGVVAMDALGAAKDAVSKSRGFKSMVEGNPDLNKMDRNKVQTYYNTLHRFNPEMASDPFVAGAWVRKIKEYDYVDPKTVGDLIQARGRLAKRPMIDPMALGQGMANAAMQSASNAEQLQESRRDQAARAKFDWAKDRARAADKESGSSYTMGGSGGASPTDFPGYPPKS